MDIVADASVFLAITLTENEKDWILSQTKGHQIVSPEVLPYEIGNALMALNKRGRLSQNEVKKGFEISQKTPVRLTSVKIDESLKIALLYNIYAYDAYYIQCCIENALPLISLDKRMCEVANSIGIRMVEKI